VTALVLLALADLATPAPPPRNAVSIYPLWILDRGLAAQYERLVRPHWSVAAIAGLRAGAFGDYRSTSSAAGAELRRYGRDTLAGTYAGLRLSGTWTHLAAGDRGVGDQLALSSTLLIGYRFVPWRTLELGPWVGLGAVTELDPAGRLAAAARPTLGFGVTTGWMF
jgi:hypothetical protein